MQYVSRNFSKKTTTTISHWFRVRKLQPPNRFPTSITISNAIAGFIMIKYHELIGFFIKNFTRLSLKSEKPEKIQISFIATFFHLKWHVWNPHSMPLVANMHKYALLTHLTTFSLVLSIGKGRLTSYGPMGTSSSLLLLCVTSVKGTF